MASDPGDPRDLRILRAVVFAAVCVALSAAGHVPASCASVPLWALGAGFLATAAVAVPLAGRARSLPAISALLAAGQIALHTLFGLGQHGAAAAASAGQAGSAGDMSVAQQAARLVCGATAASLSPAEAQRILATARVTPDAGTAAHHPADVVSGAPASLLPSLPMLLGHLCAALAAGWLLRRGDLALARLVELSAHSAHLMAEGAAVRALRGALALVRALQAGLPGAPGNGPRPCAPLPVPLRPRTVSLQHTVIRRGPPRAAFALAA
ncbi:membrane protein [Streptomyces cyaneogriseus subsp. noncyanogenus]|uniref:Membrane protein n=1 Tax=Streptomyces cyaneogriseus subsp. noncyanogenus TaxID=477245 RepID=A0A0C5G2W4_9ACTN|nr:membrane protein [Streptomyces cyaneogriseus subsp. noncyanogenus]